MFKDKAVKLDENAFNIFFSKLNLAKISDYFSGKDDVVCCLFDDLNRLSIKIVEIQNKSIEIENLLEAILITLEFLTLYINNIYFDAKEQLHSTIVGFTEIFSGLIKVLPEFLERLNTIAETSSPSSLLNKTGNIMLSGVALPGYDLIDWNRRRRFKSEPPQEFQAKFFQIRKYTDDIITGIEERQQYNEHLLELQRENLKDMNEAMRRLSSKESSSFNMSDIKLLLIVQKSSKDERKLEVTRCAAEAPSFSTVTDAQFIAESKEFEMGLAQIIQAIPNEQLNEASRLLEMREEDCFSGQDLIESNGIEMVLSEITQTLEPSAQLQLHPLLKTILQVCVAGGILAESIQFQRILILISQAIAANNAFYTLSYLLEAIKARVDACLCLAGEIVTEPFERLLTETTQTIAAIQQRSSSSKDGTRFLAAKEEYPFSRVLREKINSDPTLLRKRIAKNLKGKEEALEGDFSLRM